MTRIDPYDASERAWRAAQRAMKRRSHRTKPMQSMDSKSGLKSWYCPDCSRFGAPIITYTVSARSAPLCGGGTNFL